MDFNGHNYSHIFHIFAVSNKWIREGAQTIKLRNLLIDQFDTDFKRVFLTSYNLM